MNHHQIAPPTRNNRTHAHSQSTRRSLVLTDYLMFSAFSLGLLLMLSRPIFGIQLSNSFLKHVPAALFIAAFAFHILGKHITHPREKTSDNTMYWLWPFLLLGAYAAIGSLIAKWVFGENENFLTLGVYLLLTPIFFIWGREAGNSTKVVRPLVYLWGISTCVAILVSLARFGIEPLHEVEFWVISFFVYWHLASKSLFSKVMSLLLLIAVSALTQKLTGYALGIAAAAFIYSVRLYGKAPPKLRTLILHLIASVLAASAGLAVIGFFYFQEYLPSGNISIRLHQYEIALSSFFESPIWGKAYTANSGETFVEYTRQFNLPTHSDLLDLLKQGGSIAFALWAIGIGRFLRLFLANGFSGSKTDSFFLAMAFMTLAIIFSMAVNPLLLKPPFALVIWGVIALAGSIAIDRRKGQFNEE